jgi:hypothetical protein
VLADLGPGVTPCLGPGVYDVHSPQVPDVAEVRHLITAAQQWVERTRLWVNPDCGLETRGEPETIAALRNDERGARYLPQVAGAARSRLGCVAAGEAAPPGTVRYYRYKEVQTVIRPPAPERAAWKRFWASAQFTTFHQALT